MTFTFKPAVYRNSDLFEFPRPVLSVRVQDAWDFEQFKVPLADGDTLAGHSQEGVDISVEGQIGSHAGTLKTTEAEMFDVLEQLRAALDVDAGGSRFDFFLYHDPATDTYRHFKSCSSVRFEYDLSNKRLFTYSTVIHAEDPKIYATAPGA